MHHLKPNAEGVLVYLVEDDDALSVSLERLLTGAGFSVLSFSSAENTIEHLTRTLTGPRQEKILALVDLHLRGGKGFEVQQAAREMALAIPIIFMSAHMDARAVSQAWRDGAVDFIFKPFTPDELFDAMARVSWPEPSATAASGNKADAEIRRQFALLTPRQRTVLQRVAYGKSNTQIAAELNISTRTVKMHRESIMHRFGFQHFVDLVRFHDACSHLFGGTPDQDN